MRSLSQKERVLAFCIDLGILLTFCWVAFGTLYPPAGDKGFWFYAALLNAVIGSRLATPFFVKPVDAISTALPAFVTMMLIADRSTWPFGLNLGYVLIGGYDFLIVLMALVAIVLNNSSKEVYRNSSNLLRAVIEVVAKPQLVFAPIIVFSVFAYHKDSPLEIIMILTAMALTVIVSFGELLLKAFRRLGAVLKRGTVLLDEVAEVVAYQQPNINLLRQLDNKSVQLSSVLYLKNQGMSSKLLYALDYVGHEKNVLVRAVEIASFSRGKYHQLETGLVNGVAALMSRDSLAKVLAGEEISVQQLSSLVGIITTESSTQRVFIEVVESSNLEVGRMVYVLINGLKILYQIVEGYTREDLVQLKNTYGYIRVQAQQIGSWSDEENKFKLYSWLPMINTPVYLEEVGGYEIQENTIGSFPNSNYCVSISNINHLVTHNTAILGILGVGKSMLAIELIERMMASGIKVVCLDLTNQYRNELIEYYDLAAEEEYIRIIKAAADTDRDAWEENPDDGGSRPHLKEAIFNDLSTFVQGRSLLKIYNPAAFSATRQERPPSSYNVPNTGWVRGAALYSVTPVEVTQIVSEALLDILSAEMSDTARVCIVYEEAHSLVPEWNSVVADSDKNATSGTARAILQGRKYGLGCLLVTQRTANVTKTILNQCNTVFAMRTFDETGKGFLESYIGKDYASSLSSIKERHAVFFGRASSCENPILIKLNDRDEFRRCFRQTHIPPFIPTAEVPIQQEGPALTNWDDFEDDIPF